MSDELDRLKAAMSDKYAIERELGRGGMATVYLAEDRKHHRKVAIKVLRPELAAVLGVERFQREIEIAARLSHPHILPLHDSGEAGGFLYYVMPFVEGESLRDRMRREGQLPIDDAVRITRELAEALDTAHRDGVIHRDIKPENVLLQEGHAVLADFGIARVIDAMGRDRLTETGLAVGTPVYMSPEQATGEPELDGRSDVYALGCMLYEMLAGEPPYTGANAQIVLAKQLSDPIPSVRRLRTTVPHPLDRVIVEALAKSRADRFATAAEFGRALEGDVAKSPVLRSGRGPAITLVAAVTGLVLLLAVNPGGLRDRVFRGLGSSVAAVTDGVSVAVLPMANLSLEPDQEYFAEGMTEVLINKLSRLEGVEVPARTSVRRYRGTEMDVRNIAEELGVQYVFVSTLRKIGDEFRITTQLIDGSTGLDRWSGEFSGELRDVFTVQEETALSIADALDIHLNPKDHEALRTRYTENTEAYDSYLRGWALLESFHSNPEYVEDKLGSAAEHSGRALALEPKFALALAGQSMVEGYYYFTGLDRSERRLERADDLAQRAIDLDPLLPEANVAVAQTHVNRGDHSRAIAKYREALRLDDDKAMVWCYLAFSCNANDPPDPKAAEAAAREALRIDPGWFFSHYQLGWALEHQGRYEEAAAAFDHAVELSPRYRDALVRAGSLHRIIGAYEPALRRYKSARAIQETPDLVVLISSLYVGMGDMEHAFSELEYALELGYSDFDAIDRGAYFAPLRDDSRYEALMRHYRKLSPQ